MSLRAPDIALWKLLAVLTASLRENITTTRPDLFVVAQSAEETVIICLRTSKPLIVALTK
jgi:hypothetical protein